MGLLTALVPPQYALLVRFGAHALVVVGLIGFGWLKGAEHSEVKLNEHIAKEQAQIIAGMKAAAVTTATWQKGKDDALKAASVRAQANARAASNLRADVDGLRNDNDNFRRVLPGLASDAVSRYAATASVVLDQCGREVEDLARNADAHASDVKLLQDAWPKP
ncbi:MAG: hypothetical protein H7255_14635 [Ramlibacter sp.]|nr:hypothetical protein [Ramlibacter sp.]